MLQSAGVPVDTCAPAASTLYPGTANFTAYAVKTHPIDAWPPGTIEVVGEGGREVVAMLRIDRQPSRGEWAAAAAAPLQARASRAPGGGDEGGVDWQVDPGVSNTSAVLRHTAASGVEDTPAATAPPCSPPPPGGDAASSSAEAQAGSQGHPARTQPGTQPRSSPGKRHANPKGVGRRGFRAGRGPTGAGLVVLGEDGRCEEWLDPLPSPIARRSNRGVPGPGHRSRLESQLWRA